MSARVRLGAALPALAFALSTAAARPALAWVDAHVEGDDVRVTLDRGGEARVEHKITLKIAGGPLRSLDIRGVDADAEHLDELQEKRLRHRSAFRFELEERPVTQRQHVERPAAAQLRKPVGGKTPSPCRRNALE